MAKSVLIRNIGFLLTGDLKSPLRKADSIFVQDGVIEEIGTGIDRQADIVIDARGITAIPGLVDSQKVLDEIRQAYNYYEHMQQTASQAQVIPDWLIDKFAIAGTRAECRAQVERLKKSGINQIGLIPYGAGGGDREETLKEFAAAVTL